MQNRGRFLLVDDIASVRVTMARMFGEQDTVQAENGAQAKRILEEDGNFDVVFCDVMMPDLSGMHLHR